VVVEEEVDDALPTPVTVLTLLTEDADAFADARRDFLELLFLFLVDLV
jgi:hypothetical protein